MKLGRDYTKQINVYGAVLSALKHDKRVCVSPISKLIIHLEIVKITGKIKKINELQY